MKRALSGVLDFCTPEPNQHETMQENRRHLWEVVRAGLGCGCWWLHLGTWAPRFTSALPVPGSVELARAGSCVGKKLRSKPDSRWSELKRSRLNASAHQIGSSLVCLTPGQCSDQWGLRGPPCSSWPASLSGLPWQSVTETHALLWHMLIRLTLPAEKFPPCSSREAVNRRLLRDIY